MKRSDAAAPWSEALWAAGGILLSLFLFYPGLFLAREASLMGDHWEQHYPWAFLLAESLRRFEVPFWTPSIHCGFPIAAEGQIGIFYLPNLLLSFLLPIRWAYSYTNIFHFFLSGWGSYLYSRQMKLGAIPAFVASFIFLFGTAYGGAYYNITSLKTLAWFPLMLFFFEKSLATNPKRNHFFLAISAALSLLAGYLQVAILTLFVFFIYACLRLFFFPEEGRTPKAPRLRRSLALAAALGGALLLALPQLLLSFELALLSNRLDVTEDYAYVGSLSPFALLTLVFPTFQGFLRGNSLYGGILSLFLIFCAAFSREVRQRPVFRLWLACGVVALLLAFGEWSPLYVGLVKLTHFYSFRVPAKFLVFFCFASAILSGLGLEALLKSREAKGSPMRLASIAFQSTVLAACLLYAGIYIMLTYGRDLAQGLGHWFVEYFVHGRMGHPHSLEVYYGKMDAALEGIQALLSFTNLWNVWIFGVLLAGLFASNRLSHDAERKKVWMSIAGLILFVDLYVFAWADIKRDFDTYNRVLSPNLLVERLKFEKAQGQVGRIYGLRGEGENLPLVPSANILYGLEDIGAYSPFVMRRYFETIGQFGNINDSNRAMTPAANFVLDRLPLLLGLDVTHILSTQRLDHAGLTLLTEDETSHSFLYQLKSRSSRAFFISDLEIFSDWPTLSSRLMAPGFDPHAVLLLEASEIRKLRPIPPSPAPPPASVEIRRIQHDDNRERWSVDVRQAGFFVVTDTIYPGWQASVNGVRAPLLRAYGLFRAIWLEGPGHYEIEFSYAPFPRT